MKNIAPSLFAGVARPLFDAVPDGLLFFGRQDKKAVLEGNQAACRMLGYSSKEIRGLCLEDVCLRETPDAVRQAWELSPQGAGAVVVGDIPLKSRDGSLFYAHVTIVPLEADGRTYLLGVLRDICAGSGRHMALPPALLAALIRRVVHDVNNSLLVISGDAQLCLMEDIQSASVKENLEVIVEESGKVKEMIQGLLECVRPDRKAFKTVDSRDLVESALQLAGRQEEFSFSEIKRVYAQEALALSADEPQLKGALSFLLKNARSAMPEGGALGIATQREGDCVRIDFISEGAASSQETRKKLVTPFFPSEDGNTGIGMSACYDIIKAHGGKIMFESSPDKDAAVIVLLPVKASGG